MTRILMVDDDPHIRELVCLLLRNEGFQVYEACDGIEALTMMESTQVDWVILDIMDTPYGWLGIMS
ncbi:CheY-like chemotaxis protein [Lederbergia galactosidilyticus]|nr:CheY-like chemotaxis protein [Lederbergia galactosidilytica]